MTTQIERRIREATNAVVESIAEADDAVAQAVVGRNRDIHLIINSSFLYRDPSIKTKQSSRRVIAHLLAAGKRVIADHFWISDDETLRNHYKLLTHVDTSRLLSVASGLAQELTTIGDLLFVLLGTVKGIRPQTQEIKSPSRLLKN